MERKLLITECRGHILTALQEDGKIAELHYSPLRDTKACRIGEIYIGKVRKILPNINGAFIEIKNGVECYYSLEEKAEPYFTDKHGKKNLNVGDELLVQLRKEAVKTKQPTVSGDLNFVGKYVILSSGNRQIGVSAKLSRDQRERLLALGQSFADKDYGMIFRTNAGEAPDNRILSEIQMLEEEFHRVLTYGKNRTCFSCVSHVPDDWLLSLKNLYRQGLTEILVDAVAQNGLLYNKTEAFLTQEQPEDLKLLRAYTDASYPLCKCYSLEKATDDALSEKVWMPSGAYLVIQPTEALTVIDVNSGKCLKKKKLFADINREAAKEAAKQIRLRNLSGIILIDFINMDTEAEKNELLHELQMLLSMDPNPGHVVGMTKLQLVEITRKKIRKTLKESLYG